MKTKHEIIDIVASSYNSNTRAVRENTDWDLCVYLSSDGKKCAVGMFLTDEALEETKHCVGDVEGLEVRLMRNGFKNLDSALIEEVRGHEVYFWRDLQYLHDNPCCWDENGLSPIGQRRVEELKGEYA